MIKLYLATCAVLISSSCSTDETVVADSDVEVEAETASSSHATVAVNKKEALTHLSKEEIFINHDASRLDDSHGVGFGNRNNSIANKSEDNHGTGFKDRNSSIENRSGNIHCAGFRDGNNSMAASREKADYLECENSDIIYSQVLVVRDLNVSATKSSTANNGVVNFKRFRKVLS